MKNLIFSTPLILLIILTISNCEKSNNNHLKDYVYTKDPAFSYEIVQIDSAKSWKEY